MSGKRNLLVAVIICCTGATATATPLDDYVAAPDPAYAYGLANTFSGPGYTVNVYHMVSQSWRDAAEVDRTLWEHWLNVVVPDTVAHEKAMLFIAGGSNGGEAPTSVDDMFAGFAVHTQSIVAELRMIPNQPIKFSGETDPDYLESGRREDELITFAWDKFKQTSDPLWLPRLPMTKAAVRAMDTVQALHPDITGFAVAGGSKRGWTTWTVAAVDPRVELAIPIVIDVLNLEHALQHHWDAYGYWAPAVGDYVTMGIMDWLHTDAFRAMMAIVDPYSYAERYTMPKYIMNATGDEFFLPDSSQFYFDALPGEKHLRYVPNADHGMNAEAVANLEAVYDAWLNNRPRPQFSWTRQPDGSLRVQTDPGAPPSQVLLWQAANPAERNFRLDTIGEAWTSSPLADQGAGLYVAQATPPATGWAAFLVELTYPNGGAQPFKFTTEVSVVPDRLPFRKPGGWGTIETIGAGSDTITLVHLGGSRYEMGYWYGRLLADQVAGARADMAAFGIPDSVYDAAVAAMWKREYFDTAAWESELRGIADGCTDAGHPEMTYRELQRMTMLPDISENGCGLYVLWGAATAGGQMYQLRNLDWTMDSGLQDYPVVAVYHPEDGAAHAVIGFAGMLGAAVGGMNEHGLAVSEIMGHFCDAETLDGVPFPILLRDVLYHERTLPDALARMQGAARTNQYHYALGDPEAEEPKGRLLFSSHTRFDQYGDESVTDHPCEDPAPFHAALDGVIYWKKHNGGGNQNLYNAIQARYGSIDAPKAIEIARADGVDGTLVSIVYANTARECWVAYADGPQPAHLQEYVPFTLETDRDGVGGAGYRGAIGTGAEEVPVVVVSGTPFQMGYQYGRLMQAEIQAFVPQFMAHVQQDPRFTNENLDAAWAATNPHTDVRHEQELLGLAAGAEIDYLLLRRVHCATIIADYSCSSVAAWDTATADGHLYQTRDLDWDLEAGAHAYPALVVYMPEEGHAHVNVGFAGIVGSHTGMNDAGIALAEMGDSPGSEYPFPMDGTHFMPLFRNMLYDAGTLTGAIDILKNAPRIKRYHFVFGDGKTERAGVKIKAHSPEPPPGDLLIWTDNDPTDEFAPNVLADVVYNDEGRGAFPTLQAEHGKLDADKMMDLARQIATHGANVVNVLYDATDLECWVAYADQEAEAYTQPFVRLALAELDGDHDNIGDLVEGLSDSDGDALPNYLDDDADGDGIADLDEGADDTDNDGTPDYLDTDADADGALDGADPRPYDTDNDGLDNAGDPDDDNDGLSDADETGAHHTNPLAADSDGDGVSDGDEVRNGYDPLDPNNTPSFPAAGTAGVAGAASAVLFLGMWAVHHAAPAGQ